MARISAAKIVRRHIHATFDYSVSSLQFINEKYGTAVLNRVIAILHRLNKAKGLLPEYHQTYTKWVRPACRAV